MTFVFTRILIGKTQLIQKACQKNCRSPVCIMHRGNKNNTFTSSFSELLVPEVIFTREYFPETVSKLYNEESLQGVQNTKEQ